MTRLTIAWLMVLASLLVLTACAAVVFKFATPEILGALGAMLLTLVVKGIYAIKNRNAPEDAK